MPDRGLRAGIVRAIKWEDLTPTPVDASGDVMGWGLSASSNLKIGASNVVRLQFLHGEGIENYMNDAPADVGIEVTTSGADGVALPVSGAVAFLDHAWTPKLSTSVGYSQVVIENSNGQTPDAFHVGQYALANLLYSPVPNVMGGIEAGWIKRENNSDGWSIENWHVQASFKYNFSISLGGGE